MDPSKKFTLEGPGGFYLSTEKGLLGGYRPKKIFGELDCKSAQRALDRGGYKKHRVFLKIKRQPKRADTDRAPSACRSII